MNIKVLLLCNEIVRVGIRLLLDNSISATEVSISYKGNDTSIQSFNQQSRRN